MTSPRNQELKPRKMSPGLQEYDVPRAGNGELGDGLDKQNIQCCALGEEVKPPPNPHQAPTGPLHREREEMHRRCMYTYSAMRPWAVWGEGVRGTVGVRESGGQG